MSNGDIESVVRDALQELVESESDVDEFSWSLIPSKRLAEGGLGLQLNAWWIFLFKLRDEYLPQEHPYSELPVDENDRTLAEKTHNKELEDISYDLTKILENS